MDESEKKARTSDTRMESISSDANPDVATDDQVTPKVHFNALQTLGMAFSITAPPIAIGLYLNLIIGVGGSAYYIWALLFVAFFQLITCFAVAEMASAIPHSSGPAFWVQHLAPKTCSKFLGYLVGWLTVALWWFVAAATALYLAQIIIAIAMACNPGYNPPEWQYYLVYCACCISIFIVNLPHAFKIVPHLLTVTLLVTNATAIYLLVALLVRATPKPTAHQVFVEVVNETGWSSNGMVFFLALIPGVGTVSGFDSITHITDEVDNPTKQVPKVMIGYGFLAAASAFIMTIVYSFSIVDPVSLLQPYGHQPIIQLIFDASRSTAIALVPSIGITITLFISGTASFASWNRLYWSFAREGGLPFPRTMARLSSKDALPLNAMMVNLVLLLGIGAIQIGSLTALNAILGGAIVCGTMSFALTFGLALWRGREFLTKDRWLNLGRFGVAFQAITLIWCIFVSIWLCFPLFMPITLAYMNWTSLVFASVVVISILYWFIFRKTIVHV